MNNNASHSSHPSGWTETKLGNLIEYSKIKTEPDQANIPYVGLEHIESETGKIIGHGDSSEIRSTKSVFHQSDILYGKLRPYLNKVWLATFDGICSTDILVFPPSRSVSQRFLLYRLLSGDFVRYANAESSGVNLPRVSFKKISQFTISLPPLAEQHRIVEKIEELFSDLDAGIATLQQVQRQLRQYRQSVLKAAVEGRLTEAWRQQHGPAAEPASALLDRILAERRKQWEADYQAKYEAKGKQPPKNWQDRYKEPEPPDTSNLPELPDGWVWARVQQTGEVQLGRQRSPKHHQGEHMRPYLRVANVYEDRLDLSDVKEMNFTPDEFETYELKYGDILLNEGQSLELVGRPAMFRNEIEDCCFQNTLVRFRGYPSLNRSFALLYFRACLHSGRFQRLAGQTTSIAHLGATRFADMEFPLPPLIEQKEIVDVVDSLLTNANAALKTIHLELSRADRLRQSILKQAFAGKLVPQNPKDEPAYHSLEKPMRYVSTTLRHFFSEFSVASPDLERPVVLA